MAAVYIHVPFCRRRCSYCDFYFVTSHRRIGEYVDAVCKEIELRAATLPSTEPVRTLYFGGGTPSRLTIKQIEAVVRQIHTHFDTTQLEEVTVEVNPEDSEDDYLERLLDLGVTRLSIGIQSLDAGDLEFMFRAHTAEQGRRTVEHALRIGFDAVSLDLIFGLPDMSNERWRRNVEYAVGSGVQHVSLYGLTVEPETVLGKWVRSGDVTPAPERTMEEQYRTAHEIMTTSGFEHYEISNFARPGFRSLHNLSYWNHSNYLGLGPSAHSFWASPGALRWENPRSLRRYLSALNAGELPPIEEEVLDRDRLMSEYVLLGLRTLDGIDLRVLETRYGHHISQQGEAMIGALVDSGKMAREDEKLHLTVDGFLVADSITSMLLHGDAFAGGTTKPK
jgi:oxygen-independent coproporphyrinogen-3 oxidase